MPECEEIIKNLGLNVVGCRTKKYTHYTVHNIFLKDETDDKEILKRVKDAGLELQHDFLRHEKGLKHGASKMLDIVDKRTFSTPIPFELAGSGLEKLVKIEKANGRKKPIIKIGW